ncbi:MAG: translation initiation factor IF-2 subunit beta [Candidatus Aenigmatarchaeota archaeon]
MKYDELLEKARKSLPEIKQGTERFEIPKATIQHIGKQTAIRNFSVIVKSLRREPKELSKFMFKELAVPGTIKEGELVLQGKVNSDIIDRRISDYAKEFVFCNECRKPDTVIEKGKDASILRCEACGAKRTLRKI